MKVLVVTNMWPSLRSRTCGIFVADQVQNLRKLGLQVEVLDFDGSGWGKFDYLRLIWTLKRRIRKFRPDVVHAHYGLTGAMCVSTDGTPLLVTYHGSDLMIPWQRWISGVSALRADVNICVSETLKRRLGDPSAYVIPCGVDTEFFRPDDRDSVRKRLGFPLDVSIALFPSSKSNPIKDYPLYSAAIEATGLKSLMTLELTGISREKVREYMNAADVMVMTSKHEGYSLVVTEALACGLPIVSVPIGTIADRLDGVSQCEVVERDPRKIAHAIVSILDEGTRIHPLPKLTGLTAHDTAGELKAIYASLCTEALR